MPELILALIGWLTGHSPLTGATHGDAFAGSGFFFAAAAFFGFAGASWRSAIDTLDRSTGGRGAGGTTTGSLSGSGVHVGGAIGAGVAVDARPWIAFATAASA